MNRRATIPATGALAASLLALHVIGAAPVSIDIETPMPAPRWAQLERQLLADNVPAARE